MSHNFSEIITYSTFTIINYLNPIASVNYSENMMFNSFNEYVVI